MRQKHEHLTAYILHARPFRETSLLIDFFTFELGRYSAVAKGVHRGKSPTRAILQAFNLLTVSLQGSGELLSLTQVERSGPPMHLEGQALVCGFYLNELLVYTLHRHDPHPRLFQAYQEAVSSLVVRKDIAALLREFELVLLEELGYGFHFEQKRKEDEMFVYHPASGFQLASHKTQESFSGKMLNAIAAREWETPEVLSTARRLTRLALAPLLNGKEIRSRELL